MRNSKLIFGDLMLAFGFVKSRKGESIFQALKRQGREIREERAKVFRRATK